MKYFVLISDSTVLPKPIEETEAIEETLPVQEDEQNEAPQESVDIAETEEIEVLTDEDGTYPAFREEAEEEELPQEDESPLKSLDFLYINSTSGNVILHETAETDFLLMGYNPAVLAMTELDKSESDTAAEESAYAEESELQSEVSEEDKAEGDNEEPIESTTVEAEVDEDPFRFKEKYHLKACYLSDVKSLSDNARRLGIDAVVLDKIDANDSDRKKNLSTVSQAIFGAGYELVYFHLTKPIAENDEEAAYYLNRELLTIRDYVASHGDSCRFLLVTQSDEPSVRPFLLTYASETDARFASTLQDQAIQDPHLLFGALLETQSFDALEELVTEEEDGQTGEENEVKKPISHAVFEWIELFALSLAAVLIIMTFFIRHSPVSGDSMMPTLHENDVLIITRAGYEAENNDIVIIQSPDYDARRALVKRVIAVGGQTVRIDFDTWEIYVDGKLIKEDYINKLNEPMKRYEISNFFNKVDPNRKIFEQTVPENHVFVLGDNRNNSYDSRALGFIDERYIIGEVNFRLLPLSSIGDVE